MLAATIHFALGVALLLFCVATVAPRVFGPWVTAAFSFGAMVLVFVIPQFIVADLVATALAWRLGAFAHPLGLAGLAMHAVGWTYLAVYFWRSSHALPVLDGVPVHDGDHPFCEGMTEDERRQLVPGRIAWTPTLTHRIPAMLDVTVENGVVFREVAGVRLRLDVYRPRREDGPRPCVMYIHGGGWVAGSRRQSRFMMYELAAAGWTVFAVSYRHAPRHPLPAAIEDCKAALAWVRENAARYGGRADTVVVVGGSAGGHLAAMLAMTPGMARFQPGFEAADTRVQGAVVLYGVADFERAFASADHRGVALFLERMVFRARFRDDPAPFRDASPMRYLSASAPPVLFVHGTHDHVVPIDESRSFARGLRDAGAGTVHLLEMPFGQHAFEVFPSVAHQRAVRIIVRFMESLRGPRAAASRIAREEAVEASLQDA